MRGTVTRPAAFRVATFAQHHVEQLDLKATPVQLLVDRFTMTVQESRSGVYNANGHAVN